LTLNSVDTSGPLVTLSSGAQFVFQLNATSDEIVLLNGAAGDFAFNNNTISLIDLSGGLLGGGPIVLVDGTDNTQYSGLTLSGSTIIGGLTIDSAFLGQYPSAQLSLVGGDLMVTVPEPGGAISLMGGLGVLLVLRRRRGDVR
jgi:hypothetical protein